MATNKSTQKSQVISDYKKQVRRIKNYIKRQEKKGIFIDNNFLPPQPKTITKASVRRLEKITADVLLKHGKGIDLETGEILTNEKGKELTGIDVRKQSYKVRAQKSAQTRKENKQAEEAFWSDNIQQNETKQSRDDIRISPTNGGVISYDNVYDEYINRISSPTAKYTEFGSKRNYDAYDMSEKSRLTIKGLTKRVINEIGEEKLGERIAERYDEIKDLVSGVLFDSNAERIASALNKLAEVINGSELSMSELIDIGEQEEANESFELDV